MWKFIWLCDCNIYAMNIWDFNKNEFIMIFSLGCVCQYNDTFEYNFSF